ncbi:hypothetical protein GLYMA_11G073500v4 [Glycine max]|nr:hypothetical protein GLYMA_11G073500v4 [Glycine max]KAH1158013.1 hypothetical protein GYH30_030314 [Glycine max]
MMMMFDTLREYWVPKMLFKMRASLSLQTLIGCISTKAPVSQILKYCNSRNLAVVPQGGNTGLVGVIVCLSSMNKIIYFDKILSQIEPYVYEWTSERRGSISAEHGLGLMKANEIFYSKSRETVQVMASIKNMLDPNHILNPYKVLPHSLIS